MSSQPSSSIHRRRIHVGPSVAALAVLAALGVALGCLPGLGLEAPARPNALGALERPPAVFRMPRANRGGETYSAWFADSDGRILYFGLSPFWELWWATQGDPYADLERPGDHLIGRFDLQSEQFLPPLRVRSSGPDSRGSVWDVLVHSNGRIYYTTFFEEIGYFDPATGETCHFEGLGSGLNELAEGPDGRVYVTRYDAAPLAAGSPGERVQGGAGVLVLGPEGDLLEEILLPSSPERRPAAKSVAVDPQSREIWVNTDTFEAGGGIIHETFRLSAAGTLLERSAGPAELLFMRFDARGRGWFVEAWQAQLRLTVRQGGRELAKAILGPRNALDFVQDIHFSAEGDAVLSLWSGRIYLVRLTQSRLPQLKLRQPDLRWAEVHAPFPEDCRAPYGRALLYSAIRYRAALYATLDCGPTILRVPVPTLISDRGPVRGPGRRYAP